MPQFPQPMVFQDPSRVFVALQALYKVERSAWSDELGLWNHGEVRGVYAWAGLRIGALRPQVLQRACRSYGFGDLTLHPKDWQVLSRMHGMVLSIDGMGFESLRPYRDHEGVREDWLDLAERMNQGAHEPVANGFPRCPHCNFVLSRAERRGYDEWCVYCAQVQHAEEGDGWGTRFSRFCCKADCDCHVFYSEPRRDSAGYCYDCRCQLVTAAVAREAQRGRGLVPA